MAVYTKVSDDNLKKFLSNYDIGELDKIESILEGVENSNYHLYTSTGRYILTLYEQRVCEHDLPFFLGLLSFLSSKNIPCPQTIMQKNGNLYNYLEGRPASITSFLQGAWVKEPHSDHCYQVGRAMAEMHLASTKCNLERENSLSQQSWQGLWDKSKNNLDKSLAIDVDLINSELEYLNKYWPRYLPKGIIHADLFNDNVFFIGDKFSAMIDFYFACTDLLAYDLAISLNAWCFDSNFNYDLDKGSALIAGYQAVRSLSKEEQKQFVILARGAAMRFFLTRLYDWIYIQNNGLVVKKDPTEYYKKLKFFISAANFNSLSR